MKTCDEMVNSLFQRREQYLAEQKIKRRNAVISTALYCCAFAAVAGIGVWIKGEVSRKPIPVDSSMANPASAPVTSDPAAELPIIWAEEGIEGEVVTDYYTDWNGKQIHNLLWDALEKVENNAYSVFAVSAYYGKIDGQFVYKGKTLAQYEEEAQGKRLDHLLLLLKEADNLKSKVLLKFGRPDKEKLAKELYDNTVSVIGEELLSQYIVDGVFLKDKVLQDIPKAEEESQEIKLQHLHLLLKEAEDLEYKEMLNHMETLEKEKWTMELYDNTVSEIGDELLSQYIVDGKFLRNKVLQDIHEAAKELEVARQSFEKACAAYRVHVYDGTLKKLESQGLNYELDENSDVLTLYLTKEEFANLTLDNMSDWTFFLSSKSEKVGLDPVDE